MQDPFSVVQGMGARRGAFKPYGTAVLCDDTDESWEHIEKAINAIENGDSTLAWTLFHATTELRAFSESGLSLLQDILSLYPYERLLDIREAADFLVDVFVGGYDEYSGNDDMDVNLGYHLRLLASKGHLFNDNNVVPILHEGHLTEISGWLANDLQGQALYLHWMFDGHDELLQQWRDFLVEQHGYDDATSEEDWRKAFMNLLSARALRDVLVQVLDIENYETLLLDNRLWLLTQLTQAGIKHYLSEYDEDEHVPCYGAMYVPARDYSHWNLTYAKQDAELEAELARLEKSEDYDLVPF